MTGSNGSIAAKSLARTQRYNSDMGMGRWANVGRLFRRLLFSGLAAATAFLAVFLVVRGAAIRYETKMTGYSIPRDALPFQFGFGLDLIGAVATSTSIALLAVGSVGM